MIAAASHPHQAIRGAQFVALTDNPASPSGFQQIGYRILILYLFLIFSRIFDVKFSSLHIPGISVRIIFAMILASQAFLIPLKTRIGRPMLFMFVWFVCSIPTSMWRRGSMQGFLEAEFPAFVVFLAVGGLIGNFTQLRKALSTLASAFFILSLIALRYGSTEETGRLYLPQGKFSNPNEMAQVLLLGMCLWWFMFRSAATIVRRLFALGVLGLMLLLLSKTGSRGALIAVAIVLLCTFLRASMMGRLKLVLGFSLLCTAVMATMPARLLHRYETVGASQGGVINTGDPEADAALSMALTSAEARKYLLRESIKLTLQHPLFGVGPDMFPVAEDADAKSHGRRATWQGTHNSYTQVSSEIGIPGLVAYILIIYLSLKTSSRLYRRTRDDLRLKDIGDCALCLNCCLIVYAVTVFFDYIAYTSMLPVFSGLVSTLGRVAEAEIERRESLPATAPALPFTQFRPKWRTAGVPAEA